MKKFLVLIAAGALCATAGAASAGPTLDAVKAAGKVRCGINPSLLGFAAPDASGTPVGFDVDYCHAIAAAIFNDPSKVVTTQLNAKDRFTALQTKEIDVLTRNSTWTMQREVNLGLLFAAVNYYDGQGFMVRKSQNISSALELDGATVCVQTGTTTELNLADFFKANKMNYKVMAFEDNSVVNRTYDQGGCDVITTDASGLYATRLALQKPDDHIVLPEIISKEPLGPLVRQGDDQWFNIVKWVSFALINAEELGITKENVDQLKATAEDDKAQLAKDPTYKPKGSPDVARFVGVDGTFGTDLGLTSDWAVNVIKQMGNYGEIFDRNLGAGSQLKIARGLNALWSKGGIQYAPPIR